MKPPKLPKGWRWLRRGENGLPSDRYNHNDKWIVSRIDGKVMQSNLYIRRIKTKREVRK